ncbi:MAG: hypothetical protein VX737_05335 [Pseudomonadota bacterium]|nr:hypothetical protein [Pseudomonadota bacterium]
MNLLKIAKSITAYFLYSLMQYLILLLAVQYTKFKITSQLLLTLLQALLILFTFSAHLSLYADDQRWHWITPATIHEWIFPNNNQIPYPELSLYFQLFFCTLILSATVTAAHVLCHFTHTTQLLFMIGRLGIGTFTLFNMAQPFFSLPRLSQNTKTTVASHQLFTPKLAPLRPRTLPPDEETLHPLTPTW